MRSTFPTETQSSTRSRSKLHSMQAPDSETLTVYLIHLFAWMV